VGERHKGARWHVEGGMEVERGTEKRGHRKGGLWLMRKHCPAKRDRGDGKRVKWRDFNGAPGGSTKPELYLRATR